MRPAHRPGLHPTPLCAEFSTTRSTVRHDAGHRAVVVDDHGELGSGGPPPAAATSRTPCGSRRRRAGSSCRARSWRPGFTKPLAGLPSASGSVSTILLTWRREARSEAVVAVVGAAPCSRSPTSARASAIRVTPRMWSTSRREAGARSPRMGARRRAPGPIAPTFERCVDHAPGAASTVTTVLGAAEVPWAVPPAT